MTPNNPLVAETARRLQQMPDGVINTNAELELIALLADVVTENAKRMNKLVDRVSKLEIQLAAPQLAPQAANDDVFEPELTPVSIMCRSMPTQVLTK